MDALQQNKSTRHTSDKCSVQFLSLGLFPDHILLFITSVQLKNGSGICVISWI